MRLTVLILATCLIVWTAPASIAQDVNPRSSWSKDIAFLTRELPNKHKNLFHKIGKMEWQASGAAAEEALSDKPSVAKFVIETMRHLARVCDSHTSLAWQKAGLAVVPLQFMDFSEGVVVFSYPAKEPAWKALKVTAIDGRPLAEIRGALKPFIAFENKAHFDLQSLQILTVPALLHAAGLCRSSTEYEVTGTTAEGKELKLLIKALDAKESRKTQRSFAFSQIPLCVKQGRAPYWTRDLPKSKALYLKYNSCRDRNSFAKMMGKVWTAFDRLNVEGKPLNKLIIDLRHNGGGDSSVMNPLFAGLRERTQYRGDKLVVIIGRHTFSSAILNALKLRKEFKAKLVGEATAGKPNHFGELRSLELPESHLRVYYSTKFFRTVMGDPASLFPDVTIELTAREFLAGKDAFLEAAVKLRQSADEDRTSGKGKLK